MWSCQSDFELMMRADSADERQKIKAKSPPLNDGKYCMTTLEISAIDLRVVVL